MKLNLPSADQHEVFFSAKTIKRDWIAEHHVDKWASLTALALPSCLLQHSASAPHSHRCRRKGCSRPIPLGLLWPRKEPSNGSAFRLPRPATNYRHRQEELHRKLRTPHLLKVQAFFFPPQIPRVLPMGSLSQLLQISHITHITGSDTFTALFIFTTPCAGQLLLHLPDKVPPSLSARKGFLPGKLSARRDVTA